MNSQHFSRPLDRPDYRNQYSDPASMLERLQSPTVVISIVFVVVAFFYQSLHSSPFSRTRHPGELIWDFIVFISPARLLYALDAWLNPPMFPVASTLRPIQPRTYAAKSELLQRILGIDKPGSILNSVASVGRKGLSTLSSSSMLTRNTQQPAGLGNLDNSCFQNSILQGLTSLKPLPGYLEEALEDGEDVDGDSKNGSANTLRHLIAQLRDSKNNGKVLWTPAKLKSLDTWHQQDAQEYFNILLDEIDKEVARASKAMRRSPGLESAGMRDDSEASQHSDDSGYQSLSALSKAGSEAKVLRNPLEGLVAQRVACVQCGYSEGLSMIPFNCLTLTLGVGTREHDIFERLESYTHLESIEGVVCGKCTLLKVRRLLNIIISRGKASGQTEQLRESISRLEAVEMALEEDDYDEKALTEKCKVAKEHRVRTTKTKQVVIARPPQSLAIHMNRSAFDERTGLILKNLAAVRFPKTLDLGPWCLGSASGSEVRLNETPGDDAKYSLGEEEQWLSEPKLSMISGDVYPSKITGPIYELRAVITHQGQHENGHYVCYRKHPRLPAKSEDLSSAKSNISIDGEGDRDETKTADGEQTLVDTTLCDSSEDEDGQWWRLSDESVWEVSEDQVLAQGGVFMLFYDCVDPHSVLVKKDELDVNTSTSEDLRNAEEDTSNAEVVLSQVHDEKILDLAKATMLPTEEEEDLAQKDITQDTSEEEPRNAKTADTLPKPDEVVDTFVSSLLRRPNA